MSKSSNFADVLNRYVQRLAYTPGQLARLSDIPQPTIVNWLKGRVKKPRQYTDLVKLAAILQLNESEATELFQSAGHPPLSTLIAQLHGEESQNLLSPWLGKKLPQNQAPFQAIARTPYFVGRKRELRAIREALLAEDGTMICSLQGMGGIGKTTLAAHLAYQLRLHFPDGVLWAKVDTADPMSVLSAFANAYDRDVSQYTDLDSRSQVVRQLLAHKRTLIVLDNVQSSDEVKPLLPPTNSCAVIITTRRHDLSVTRGTHRFHIREFNEMKGESLALFREILGEARVRQEKTALKEVAELLGRLPLAVAIAASRLAYEPDWQVTDFLERLRSQKRRLSELADEAQDVRLSFDLSYETLSPSQRDFFNRLGVFGGEDFDAEAVSFVTGIAIDETRDQLRRLYSLSLVQHGRPDRYYLHPLLRDYAREKRIAKGSWEQMVEYYIRYVESHGTDYEALDLEASNIFAALQTAAKREMGSALVRGANSIFHFLKMRGSYKRAKYYLKLAQTSTAALDDTSGLMTILRNLGQIARSRGDYEQAESYIQEGLALARADKDQERISSLLTELGTVIGIRGHHTRAEPFFWEGLALARETQQEHQIITLLTALGIVAVKQGKYAHAKEHFQEGLRLARKIKHRERIGALLANLGMVALDRGNRVQAEAYYRESLALNRQIGHREGISLMLGNLSEVARLRGDGEEAEVYAQEGLAFAREIENRALISIMLRRVGEAAYSRKTYKEAETFLKESLSLSRQIGHHENISATLMDLAVLASERERYEQAAAYLKESLLLGREVGRTNFLCQLLNEWGTLCLRRRKLGLAASAFNEALEKAREIDNQEHAAAAFFGLAQISAMRGRTNEAAQQGQQSLALFADADHPRVNEVEAWLVTLPNAN